MLLSNIDFLLTLVRFNVKQSLQIKESIVNFLLIVFWFHSSIAVINHAFVVNTQLS